MICSPQRQRVCDAEVLASKEQQVTLEALKHRYLHTLTEELGLSVVAHDDRVIVFKTPDGISYRIVLYDRDPEYLELIGLCDGRELERHTALELTNELTRAQKGAKLTLTNEGTVMIAVECIVAPPDRLPSIETLAAVLPRACSMICSAAHSFLERCEFAVIVANYDRTPGPDTEPGVSTGDGEPADDAPQVGRILLDEALLDELGLGALEVDAKNQMLATMYETLEQRVGMQLAGRMTTEQLEEFEQLFDAGDRAAASRWLEQHFPEHPTVVREQFERLKDEIRDNADEILATEDGYGSQSA